MLPPQHAPPPGPGPRPKGHAHPQGLGRGDRGGGGVRDAAGVGPEGAGIAFKIGGQLHNLAVAADGEETTVRCDGKRMPPDQALAEMANKTNDVSWTGFRFPVNSGGKRG